MKRVILLVLVLRLIGIFIFRNIDNYDLKSYMQVGELTLKGINIYPKIANLHHPYFPFFLYIEGLAIYIGKSSMISTLILKIIINFFDLGNVILIYLLTRKNIIKAFLYGINPVSILIFTLHGQLDAIPIFFLLYSLYLIKVREETLSILSLSTAVMFKTWPILFFISVYKRLKIKKLIPLIFALPVLSVIIYSLLFKTSIYDIGKTLVNYQGLWGIWGPWMLLPVLRQRWQKLFTGIFLLIFFLVSCKKKSKSIFKEIFYLLFFFYVFTPTFSIQYFSWFMPFLIIVKPKNYWLILLSIASYLVISYSSWRSTLINQSVLMILGLILWLCLASVFWMAYQKRKSFQML